MKRILSFLSILIFCSCEFELNDDLGLNNYESEYVVNAAINPSTPAWAEIIRSAGILQNANFYPIIDASVSLRATEGDFSLEVNRDGHYVGNPNIRAGQEYQLEVRLPDNTVLTATETIPDQIVFESLLLEDSVSVTDFGAPLSRLTLSFNDPADKVNFYELLVYQFTSRGEHIFLPFRSNNINIENSGSSSVIGSDASDYLNQALVSDRLFDGKLEELEVELVRANPEEKVYVSFKSLSANYYDYLYRLSIARENLDNPFTEHISITSNVEGGLGIFAGYTLALDSIP